MEDDIHIAQLELCSKVANFLDIYVKIQTLVHEEKYFKGNIETLKATIDNITTF